MEGLAWQTLHLGFLAGLNQRQDDRFRQPPYLDIALDVQATELGGLQLRYPFATIGSPLEDARRVYPNGSELLVFTKDTLYTWDSANSDFVSRGTHLAVKVDEQPVFITTDDQIDVDRAELDGVIVYTWGIADGTDAYVAAVSKDSGAVLLAPTEINSLGGSCRPRVIALATVLMLFWIVPSTGVIRCRAIDPADVAGSVAGSATGITSLGTLGDPDSAMYDVVKVAGADTAIGAGRLDPSTSYIVFKVTAAMSVSSTSPARPCDGPIAVSSTPDGTSVQVIRADGLNIEGDLITVSSLADTAHVNKAVGTVAASCDVFQIAAAHRSVADSGQFRCYAFWYGVDEGLNAVTSGANDWQSRTNWVDTGGNLGTEGTFVRRLAVASRAFDHDGRVFVGMVFGGESAFASASVSYLRSQLQNTYFLYRDDGFLTAKAAAGRAGGIDATFREGLGRLPGVAAVDTNEYACALTERRIVPLTPAANAYTDRGPRDITFTFDSNEARRVARIGQTLYITGGELLQYDGTRLVEVGHHIYPWYAVATENNGTGLVPDGTVAYKGTLRYDNARGEVDRSTTASHGDITLSGGTPQRVIISDIVPLYVTHKTDSPPAFEVWRTKVDPVEDSDFFLVTSRDPANDTNPNRYFANDPTASDLPDLQDHFSDATLEERQASPENGAVLENIAPPACSIIIATDTRLFLGGVAGDPDRVWYSHLRGDGEVAKFHDANVFEVPADGGDITAIAAMGEVIVVFRERAAYAFAGTGFGNLGSADGSQNYQLVREVSRDVGAVSHEAVALTADGLLFKSSKGWMLIDRGLGVRYVGAPITDYDTDEVLAIHVLEGQHQVRVLTDARMLVFDTVANQWFEWTVADGIHAALWSGQHVYLTATGPKLEQSTYSGVDFGLDVETAWIKPADLHGAVRLRWLEVLAEYRGAHDLRLRIAYDYNPTYVDDRTWTVSPTTVGGPEQVRLGPSRQQCQAFKLRITAQAVGSATPPTSEALKLTGLGVELGVRRGLNRRLPAAQKV